VEREARPSERSLHELVSAAVQRCGRARADSRALVEEHERLDLALRDTLEAIRRRRRAAQRPKRSETDRSRA
jgi:hypothetical protein